MSVVNAAHNVKKIDGTFENKKSRDFWCVGDNEFSVSIPRLLISKFRLSWFYPPAFRVDPPYSASDWLWRCLPWNDWLDLCTRTEMAGKCGWENTAGLTSLPPSAVFRIYGKMAAQTERGVPLCTVSLLIYVMNFCCYIVLVNCCERLQTDTLYQCEHRAWQADDLLNFNSGIDQWEYPRYPTPHTITHTHTQT